jgi:hypothetical protein
LSKNDCIEKLSHIASIIADRAIVIIKQFPMSNCYKINIINDKINILFNAKVPKNNN